MSPAEAKLYAFLHEQRNSTVSPSISEMNDAMGKNSRAGIWQRLQNLEKAGFITIERRGGGRRNLIRLTSKRPAGYAQTVGAWMLYHNGRFLPGTIRFSKPRGGEGERYGGEFLPVIVTIEENTE